MNLKNVRLRLGLWLIRPWLKKDQRKAYWHAKNHDIPESYHPDWWWGQYFALHNLDQKRERGRRGISR